MSDTPLQLVLEFEDAYLVRDAIGVVRSRVLANATPNEIFQQDAPFAKSSQRGRDFGFLLVSR
jgi:hypothetical protein